MERNDGARDLRMADRRPWVGVGRSLPENPTEGTGSEPTAFRRLTDIAPGETQPDFGQRPAMSEPAVD